MIFIDLYYLLKPLIPRRLQIAVRRVVIRRQRKSKRDEWPILESAGVPPAGWRGWPDGKKFALVLTHDVDTARGQDRCLRLADMEAELGFTSSFNIVPEQYPLKHEIREELRRSGFEIGVHGLEHDGKLFRSRKTFGEKAERINEYIKQWGVAGFRSPSVLHNLEWLRQLHVEYDASTFDTDPFEPQPQGAGTIFPFIVSGDGTRAGYVELPYTLAQDFTLFILLREPDIGLWKTKLDWIAERGGMALINVHPDYLVFDGAEHGAEEYPAAYYRHFLEYVKTRYAGQYWHVQPREVARYVAARPGEFRTRTLKKICMMAYAFYDTDNRIMRYAETLARRGDEVDVIALRRPGQLAEEMVRGVRVFRIQERERNERFVLDYFWRMLRFLFASARMLGKLQGAQPYHVVHVHSVPDFEVFAAWPAKRRGARVILDIHDIVPEFYASKFKKGTRSILFRLLVAAERWSTGFADKVIIANHIWQKRIVERSVPANKCSVVLNYVDTGLFHRRARKRADDRFRAVYPGGLQSHQGLDVAIRAFARVKQAMPHAELHIYGDGSERENLVRLVDELGLGQNVFIHGMVPHDQVAQVIADADLGIVPKRADSFGNEAYSTKILEFMSQGIPVVASRTMIDTYYFREPAVKFFESGNDADLAGKILQVARDGELRRTMVEAADVCLAENSWAAKQDEYLNLVDDLSKIGSPEA